MTAYEIKIRVTTAASGQGRWAEELQFPRDCQASGYTPILVVLDPTRNPKLDALERIFRHQRGEAYIGQDAWSHLKSLAGPTMARFLDLYIHAPLAALLADTPQELQPMTVTLDRAAFTVSIGTDHLRVARDPGIQEEDLPMPDVGDTA